jgi:hypothetical protein
MKKDFKIGAEKFISALDENETQSTQETHETHSTDGTQGTQQTHRKYNKPAKVNPFRINLKLRAEYKDYLEVEAWKQKKSVTEFINDLIKAHKDSNQ